MHRQLETFREVAMKKIILTAAVSVTLLFALIAGTAGIPSVQEPSAGTRQQCAGCISGHYALTAVW
jgi:hypothetical protein